MSAPEVQPAGQDDPKGSDKLEETRAWSKRWLRETPTPLAPPDMKDVLDGRAAWERYAHRVEAERAELRVVVEGLRTQLQDCAKLRSRIVRLHVWTNEAGLRFVYSDDLLGALDGKKP